ncbi:hypothetical protein [Pseudomonas corrugata]|uniref:hypothetical protein n=1 Tax=Pseudomonas corrugata TaxID=47879 RepID=UPI0012BCA546|nr:hypothetical protein [Pseudomonas corrugata]
MMILPSNLQQWRTHAFRRENVTFSDIDDYGKNNAIMLALLRCREVKGYGKSIDQAWQAYVWIAACTRAKIQ